MAPVVHGLEKEYEGRIDFVYLNIAVARNDSAKRAFGFRATPHMFFVSTDGVVRDTVQGVVAVDSLRVRLDRMLSVTPPSR
ncbi:MAG: hypothetical protein WD825_12985 [Gemmatimonadaceae bacterium]